MKIYTKGGDSGQTGLFGGQRVPKDHLRIQTYGVLDELNASLGVVLAETTLSEALRERLSRLQGELFQVGAELATPRDKKLSTAAVDDVHIQRLEAEIDAMEGDLAPLKTFILPAGARASALLHFSRTIARRAERQLVVLHRAEPVRNGLLMYVNRLSDYLFVCARLANLDAGVSDVPWTAP